jgi:hypothetical protein
MGSSSSAAQKEPAGGWDRGGNLIFTFDVYKLLSASDEWDAINLVGFYNICWMGDEILMWSKIIATCAAFKHQQFWIGWGL